MHPDTGARCITLPLNLVKVTQTPATRGFLGPGRDARTLGVFLGPSCESCRLTSPLRLRQQQEGLDLKKIG
jgi:hypothetical protein